MANDDNQKQPFIYDRTTGEKIPVSKEVRDAYYGEAARIRMKEQAHGRCVCPQSKVWACDGDCLICEYRRSGDLASLDVPIGEDGEDTLMDMVPSEAPAIESIIADRDLLDRLFARLRLDHLIARAFQIDDNEAANARFVLQNQYLFHRSSPVLRQFSPVVHSVALSPKLSRSVCSSIMPMPSPCSSAA